MDILIYGIINSFSLALMAIGFTLVYGISRLPNFTGFLVWSLIHLLKLNYILSIILALVIMGLVGAAVYRFVLIRVRGMATSEIIATYALGLAILEFLRWAGFRGMTYTLPVFIEGSISIKGVPVDLQRIVVVGIGIVVVSFMWLFTHFNKTGLALRGMAQDEHAAMMLGIDSDWMAVIAMGMGSILAGLAAIALLPLGNIVVEAGYNVLILSIAVCIVGGLGSWVGAIIASFMIGFLQIITVAYIQSHFHMVVALLAIIITLILRPSGLFGRQKELEERV
jgi:branched-chain amino acid transport system permease protein